MDFIEPEWDPTYVMMLDAVMEYLDSIGQREDKKITQRDINIIQALIEFYDFEVTDKQDILDVLDDVKMRANQLDNGESNH